MEHYYGTKREARNGLTEGFRGRVYHFDTTGEKEIEMYLGPLRIIKALAVDDAAE